MFHERAAIASLASLAALVGSGIGFKVMGLKEWWYIFKRILLTQQLSIATRKPLENSQQTRRQRDSNPRPSECNTDTLPQRHFARLILHNVIYYTQGVLFLRSTNLLNNQPKCFVMLNNFIQFVRQNHCVWSWLFAICNKCLFSVTVCRSCYF